MATSEGPTKKIGIFVTGKSSSGKSSLVNGILGLKIEDEERLGAAEKTDNVTPETYTTEVKQYQCTRDNVLVTVWDTPGLHDGTGNKDVYVEEMVDKCSQNVDLMIYCINSSVTRFVESPVNPEVEVITTLTRAFGKDIWSKTIIALTFANAIERFHPNWATLRASDKALKFSEVILQFDKRIRNLLRTYAKVPEDIASEIKIIPAGYYDERSLPDREYWLSDFWFGCFETISAAEKQAAFYSLSASRIREREDAKEYDFEQDIEQQPIIPHDDTKKKMLVKVTKYGAVGVAAGAGVGAVSSGLGVVPLSVGALIGGAVLVGIGFFVNARSKNLE